MGELKGYVSQVIGPVVDVRFEGEQDQPQGSRGIFDHPPKRQRGGIDADPAEDEVIPRGAEGGGTISFAQEAKEKQARKERG